MLAKFQLVMVKACPYHQKEQKKQWYQGVSSNRIWDRHMTFTRFEKGDFPHRAFFLTLPSLQKFFRFQKRAYPNRPIFFVGIIFISNIFGSIFKHSVCYLLKNFWNVHYVELIKTTRQLVFKILEQLQNYKLY